MAMLVKGIEEIKKGGNEVVIADFNGKKYTAPLLPKGTPGKNLPAGIFAIETDPGYAFGYEKDEMGRCRVLPLQAVSIG